MLVRYFILSAVSVTMMLVKVVIGAVFGKGFLCQTE